MALADKQRIAKLEKFAKQSAKWYRDVKKWAKKVNGKLGATGKGPGGGQTPPAPPSWPPN